MRKIFLYECKRLLWNKFFFGILLILLLFGWQVLDQVTIQGVAHTAPFSPWSFGDYLSRMLPLLWIGALFFLTFFTSEKARRVTVLTDTAPVPPRSFAMIRGAAALASCMMYRWLRGSGPWRRWWRRRPAPARRPARPRSRRSGSSQSRRCGWDPQSPAAWTYWPEPDQ